jgi:hypothetical protein
MILKLTNNLSKIAYEFEVIDWHDSNIFFHFELKIEEDMAEGEYTYELFDGDTKVAQGLLQIGDYKPQTKEYNNKKTYKVYGK